MSRYKLQLQNSVWEWVDTDFTFKTKSDLEEFIGIYGVDYDWRVGYTFKHYDHPVGRFVWNSGKKKGEEVRV